MLVRFAPRGVSPDCPALAWGGECRNERGLTGILRSSVLHNGGGWRSWEGFKKMARRLHESFLQCQIDVMSLGKIQGQSRDFGYKFLWR